VPLRNGDFEILLTAGKETGRVLPSFKRNLEIAMNSLFAIINLIVIIVLVGGILLPYEESG